MPTTPSLDTLETPAAQLRALADRQRGLSVGLQKDRTFEEWQSIIATYLRDCLAFYDTHADSPLRWEAIAMAQHTTRNYHWNRYIIAGGGGHGWFPKSPEIAVVAVCRIDSPTPLDVLEYHERTRKNMMLDPVLNSAEFTRVLVI